MRVLIFVAMLAFLLAACARPAQKTAPPRSSFNDLVVQRIIFLESSGRHDGVWGDGGASYGCCQFQRRTFDQLSAEARMEWLDWRSREDQVTLLVWAVNHGRGKHWTTYRPAVRWAIEQRGSVAIPISKPM